MSNIKFVLNRFKPVLFIAINLFLLYYINMSFILSISSACDVAPSQLIADKVKVFPDRYLINGRPFDMRPDLDSEFDEVCSLIKSGGILTRVQPTVNDYEEYFDSILERGVKSLLHISVGSEYSDDYAAAERAVRREMVKFPRAEIVIMDSHTMSAGFGFLYTLAIGLREMGKSASEAYVTLTERAKNIDLFFIASDLSSLARQQKMLPDIATRNMEMKVICALKINENKRYSIKYKTHGNALMARFLTASVIRSNTADRLYTAFATDYDVIRQLRRNLEGENPARYPVETSRMGLFTLSVLGASAYSVAIHTPEN